MLALPTGSASITKINSYGGLEIAPNRLSKMAEKPECVICYEEYLPTPTHRPASLLCGHFLHHACLENLLANNDRNTWKCPSCRENISASDVRLLYGTLPNSKQNPDYTSFSREELETFIKFAVNHRVRLRLQELGAQRHNKSTRTRRNAEPAQEEFFVVDEILFSKFHGGIHYYCVQWKDYPGEDSWEPAYCLGSCTGLIRQFTRKAVRVAPPNLPPFPYGKHYFCCLPKVIRTRVALEQNLT